MINTRVMRWSREHRDHYVYNPKRGLWVKEACMLRSNWTRCTAPGAFPRGTTFDYNGKLREEEDE